MDLIGPTCEITFVADLMLHKRRCQMPRSPFNILLGERDIESVKLRENIALMRRHRSG